MQNDFLLIGVDGGATKVNAWSIKVDDRQCFTLGKFNHRKSYSEYPQYDPHFTPVEIQRQLEERDRNEIRPTEAEQRQGQCYIAACADAIIEMVKESRQKRVLVGIGMPGLKTEDQRGIAAMANGPRMIDYAERIEDRLKRAGVELVRPVAHIGSDAYYCGLGEEYAAAGQFRKVANSYYLGGGTGAADALKLKGKLISLDEIGNWFVKTWELKCPEGRSVEKYVSSKGIQSIYAELTGKSIAELNQARIYPPQIRQRALEGDLAARQTFEKVAKYLALLMYERITTLYVGWQGIFELLNPHKPQPAREHPYRFSLLDNLIIGQRLGELLKISRHDAILWQPFIDSLNLLLVESELFENRAMRHYCPNGRFAENRIVISKLKAAPALGAGIDAYLNI